MGKDLFAKAPENKEFKIMPAGSHVARCYSIVDLGTQEKVFKQTWEVKEVHVIRITWEFPTELDIFDVEKWEQPFVLGEEYTLSLADKANLRNVLESWLGRPLTEDELKDWYNLRNLVGKECLIGVIHTKSKDGSKTYANIQTIGQIPKGLVCPLQINKSQYFVLDTEDFDQETFDNLPEFVQKKIEESKEYKVGNTFPEFS